MTWYMARYLLLWIKNSRVEWIFKVASGRIYNVSEGKQQGKSLSMTRYHEDMMNLIYPLCMDMNRVWSDTQATVNPTVSNVFHD